MTTLKPITITEKTPVATMFVDEAGAKHSTGRVFVIGMVKVRNVGLFLRGVRDIRDKHRFYQELKFSQINHGSVDMYVDLAEYLASSPVRVCASVYDADTGFAPGKPTWEVQAQMTAKLVVGNINQGEVANILLDLVQTPKEKSAALIVRENARNRLKSTCILEAYDLDSHSTDGLQMADFVASAICYGRRYPDADMTRAKACVADRFRRAFRLDDFSDAQRDKVNILTMKDDPAYRNLKIK